MREQVPVRWQFGLNGFVCGGTPEDPCDANEATVWKGAHGDTHLMTFRWDGHAWVFDSGRIPRELERVRWRSPGEALAQVGRTWEGPVAYVEAVCRCGVLGGECD